MATTKQQHRRALLRIAVASPPAPAAMWRDKQDASTMDQARAKASDLSARPRPQRAALLPPRGPGSSRARPRSPSAQAPRDTSTFVKLPQSETSSNPCYKTDAFVMLAFKVRQHPKNAWPVCGRCRGQLIVSLPPQIVPCSKRFSHDWVTCPFAHPGESAQAGAEQRWMLRPLPPLPAAGSSAHSLDPA